MPPQLTGQQVVKALRRAGFEHVSTRGSHAKLRDIEGRVVIVPLNTKPSPAAPSRRMRQAGLRAEDLQGLL